MYTIEWESNSSEEINSLSKDVALRIYNKVNEISANPEHFIEKMKNMPEFKVRIGNYRAILLFDKANHILRIQAVGHRKNIYKKYKTD